MTEKPKVSLAEHASKVPGYFKGSKVAMLLNALGILFCLMGLVSLVFNASGPVSFVPVGIGVMFFLISIASRAVDFAEQKQPPFVIVNDGEKRKGMEYN